MSKDWDESRWMCAAAVAPKRFLKTSSSSATETTPQLPPLPHSIDNVKTSKRLKPEKWRAAFDKEGRVVGFQKVIKAIITGGIDSTVRAEVWEFLLGCYPLDTTTEYRQQLREIRRQRYKELIEQCQLMHGSIGSGSLAYTVGSRVMDVRIMSKDSARQEAKLRAEAVNASARRLDDGRIWKSDEMEADETYEDSREDFEDGGNPLDGVYNTTPTLNSDEESESVDSDGEAENSVSEEEKTADYLRLPVRTLFPNYVMGDNENNISSSEAQCTESKGINVQDHDRGDKSEVVQSSETDGNCENQTAANSNSTSHVSPDVSEEKIAEWLWTLHRIVVDVVRTDRHLKFYEDSKNMARMSDILAVYAWVDPATGYCQGMSDLLSPFIMLFQDNADAFWCFESLLRRVRQNFQMEGPVGVMKQLQALTKILEFIDLQMYRHLVQVGADNFLFAFRMLLVLFRRELSFGEALCMWEMMWAADFDYGIAWALEYNCLDALAIKYPIQYNQEEEESNSFVTESNSSQKQLSPLYAFPEQVQQQHDGIGYYYSATATTTAATTTTTTSSSSSRSPLCGLRAGNLWPRHRRHRLRTVSSLLGKSGDDELSVFVVAAILVVNRSMFLKNVHCMDDAIKVFNELQMEIKVRVCVRTAIKLRKKYQQRMIKRAALERRASGSRGQQQQ